MTHSIIPPKKLSASEGTENRTRTRHLMFTDPLQEVWGALTFLDLLETMGTPSSDSQVTASAHMMDAKALAAEKSASDTKQPQKETMPSTSSASHASTPILHASVQADRLTDDPMLTLDGQSLTTADMQQVLQWVQGVTPPFIPTMLHPGLNHLEQSSAFPYTRQLSGLSADLQERLQEAYRSQRPLRVELADDAAVILRLGRDGQVSAEFVAASASADAWFRQGLLELRQRLEARHLSYGRLWVRDPKQHDPQEQKES
jgi:hypothetical protein